MDGAQEKIEWLQLSVGFILPELILTIGIILIIIIGLISKSKLFPQRLSLATIITSLTVLLFEPIPTSSTSLFIGMLEHDGFAQMLRIIISASGLLFVLISDPNSIVKKPAEYFTLSITVILGAQLLVMSSHFVMLIIALELMSIPSYVLAGFAFNKKGAEASMKYFIYGSLGTATLIFGVSWLYGISESLQFSSSAFTEKLKFNETLLFLFGGLAVIGGLLFKMAAAPAHFWAPDIYEATPMPILVLFSTIPKFAGGGILLKFVLSLTWSGQPRFDWQSILAILSILTLTVGNFSALWQHNVKRLMAYSSIGQAGFLLLALTCFNETGAQVYLFYIVILGLGNVLVFSLLKMFETEFGCQSIEDFAGLGKNFPLQGALLTIGFLSLVGLPITAGFTAKLFIFTALLLSYGATPKIILIVLFTVGLLNTVVSLYYYLRVPYFMFLKEAKNPTKTILKKSLALVLTVTIGLAIIWLFFQPGILMGFLNKVTFAPR